MKRWCFGCAAGHAGAAALYKQKICEDCRQTTPTYGLSADQKRSKRWCAKCAAGHVGAVCFKKPSVCEDCELKSPSFRLPDGAKVNRWCGNCTKGHAGTVSGLEQWARTATRSVRGTGCYPGRPRAAPPRSGGAPAAPSTTVGPSRPTETKM
jgi:hypothetical protein